jgi:hypothetical protein
MKFRVYGKVLLYDFDKNFITSEIYRYKSQRNEIIAKWNKMYRLKDKSYFLVIIPETKHTQYD